MPRMSHKMVPTKIGFITKLSIINQEIPNSKTNSHSHYPIPFSVDILIFDFRDKISKIQSSQSSIIFFFGNLSFFSIIRLIMVYFQSISIIASPYFFHLIISQKMKKSLIKVPLPLTFRIDGKLIDLKPKRQNKLSVIDKRRSPPPWTDQSRNTSPLKQKLPIMGKRKMDLSDYEGFEEQSAASGKNNYPSIFGLLRITPSTKQNKSIGKISDVCALSCTRLQLVKISTEVFQANEFFKKAFLPETIQKLIFQIAQGYKDVSYHNFTHGFSLMQLLYNCLELDQNFSKVYSYEEKGLYLLAALAHDLGHRGTNNSFEMKIRSGLAKIAHNQSVLEKMHIRKLFQIFSHQPQFDVVSKSSNPLSVKKAITSAILATDIAKHFQNLSIFQKKREQKTLNLKESEDKMLLMGQVIHACDIGNPTLAFNDYLNWAILLTYQFNQQAKTQEGLGLQVSEGFKFEDINGFIKEQNFFLGNYVLPLWKEISTEFPGIASLAERIPQNLDSLEQIRGKQV